MIDKKTFSHADYCIDNSPLPQHKGRCNCHIAYIDQLQAERDEMAATIEVMSKANAFVREALSIADRCMEYPPNHLRAHGLIQTSVGNLALAIPNPSTSLSHIKATAAKEALEEVTLMVRTAGLPLPMTPNEIQYFLSNLILDYASRIGSEQKKEGGK